MSPLLLPAGLAVFAVVALVWVLTSARQPRRAVSANLTRGGIADVREVALTRPATERAVVPLTQWTADRVRRMSPVGWIDRLDRQLTLAGRPVGWPLERVMAAKLMLAVAAAGLGVLHARGALTVGRLLVALVAAALVFHVPDVLVNSRATRRQDTLRKELPDTLDQMTIAVEAGIGLEGAMARAARVGEGPVADEFRRTLQDIQLGSGRGEAMRALSERSDVRELQRLVHAINQAEVYGIPVADVLRTQAGELRTKRRQWAEERAMKIPVKIIFPLVLCILPTLFIVIIGPAAIRISRVIVGGFGG